MHRDALFYRHLILWLWFAWALVWAVGALRSKATRRRESLGSRLAHVAPLLIGGVLLGWPDPPGGVPTLPLWPHSSGAYLFGLALLIAGLGVAVWARVHLGRNWSGTITVKEDHELIRTGPYAYVRHPIYTGLLAAVLGTAIASGTVGAALGFVIFLIALLRKLRAEEVFKRATFPAEYPRNSAEVPALVPFVKRPRVIT